MDESDDEFGGVVHVEDRRIGVQTGGVELVRVLHRQLAKGLEVLGKIGLLELLQSRLHHMLCPELEQRTRQTARLHTFVKLVKFYSHADGRLVALSKPEVDEVSFSLSLTTRTTARISGQYC